MAQTQLTGGSGHDDEEDTFLGGGQSQVSALDALLDQIDVVLEENAQSFVQGFVQKGGQ